MCVYVLVLFLQLFPSEEYEVDVYQMTRVEA